MASEATSKATGAAGQHTQGLSTVYVPLDHRHHEHANVIYGIVGNSKESLPGCTTLEYMDFHHTVLKVRFVC